MKRIVICTLVAVVAVMSACVGLATPASAVAASKAAVTTQLPTSAMSRANALLKAKSYLTLSGFSRSGLIEQLQFEGFSKADAIWAVDATKTNWNKQAARKAASYLKLSGFSRSGLIEQLMFEGFTKAQAQYGVKAVGY